MWGTNSFKFCPPLLFPTIPHFEKKPAPSLLANSFLILSLSIHVLLRCLPDLPHMFNVHPGIPSECKSPQGNTLYPLRCYGPHMCSDYPTLRIFLSKRDVCSPVLSYIICNREIILVLNSAERSTAYLGLTRCVVYLYIR